MIQTQKIRMQQISTLPHHRRNPAHAPAKTGCKVTVWGTGTPRSVLTENSWLGPQCRLTGRGWPLCTAAARSAVGQTPPRPATEDLGEFSTSRTEKFKASQI